MWFTWLGVGRGLGLELGFELGLGVGVGVGVGVRVGVRAGVGGLGEDLVRVLVGAGYEEVWVAEDRLDRHLVELGVG